MISACSQLENTPGMLWRDFGADVSKFHSLFSISFDLIPTPTYYISSLREQSLSSLLDQQLPWDQCAHRAPAQAPGASTESLRPSSQEHTQQSCACPDSLRSHQVPRDEAELHSCPGRERAEHCLLCPAFKPLPCTDLALPGPVSQPCHLPLHRHCISLYLQF